MSDATLQILQDKMKRQPQMYKEEFREHLAIFKGKLSEFKESPAKRDEQLEDYLKFMAHISAIYRDEVADYLCTELLNMLQ